MLSCGLFSLLDVPTIPAGGQSACEGPSFFCFLLDDWVRTSSGDVFPKMRFFVAGGGGAVPAAVADFPLALAAFTCSTCSRAASTLSNSMMLGGRSIGKDSIYLTSSLCDFFEATEPVKFV